MKRNTYQKLLMSVAIVAFFGTLASAQVLSRSQVDAQQIQSQKQIMSELKAKAKAQGLTAIPTEWIEESKQQRNETVKQVRSERVATSTPESKEVKKAVLKPNIERKLIKSDRQSIREKAKQITPPRGFKVVVTEVGGKEYIEFVKTADGTGMNPVRAKN